MGRVPDRGGGPMKSNLHPQRCHRGRKGKMAPSNQQEDERREREGGISLVRGGRGGHEQQGGGRGVSCCHDHGGHVGRGKEEARTMAGQTEERGRRYQDGVLSHSGFQSSGYHGGHSGGYQGGVTVASRHLHTQEVDT